MVKYTEFKMNGLQLGYELYEDGYGIYFGDVLTIVQHESYVPHPGLPYGINAILQIKDLCGIRYDLNEEIKKTLPLTDEEQTRLDMALNVEYLICLEELKA